MAPTVLAVPIRVDALFLEHERAVLPAEIDVSRLPYRTPAEDIHPESAWLGERVASQPFDDDRLRLKAGVHLHWTLPEAFRTGTNRGRVLSFPFDAGFVQGLAARTLTAIPPDMQKAGIVAGLHTDVIAESTPDGTIDRWRVVELLGGRSATIRAWAGNTILRVHITEPDLSFPAVPNRWLIRRTGQNGPRFWLVESDYLHDEPPAESERQAPILYPVITDTETPGGRRPYQWLGRVHQLPTPLPDALSAAGRSGPATFQLTAIGYGNPSFAAFYPNCHSVFGFHDPEITPPLNSTLAYDVFGWQGEASRDALQSPAFASALDQAKKRYKVENPTPDSPSLRALQAEALRNAFGWTATGFPEPPDLGKLPPPTTEFPSRTFLVGRVQPGNEAPVPTLTCTVAMGHTGTEALSAYAAARLGHPELEDQLEALHLEPKLEGLRFDLGPKFAEARHEKEFAPFDSGRRWTLLPRDPGADETSGGQPNLGQANENVLAFLEKLKPLLKQLNEREAVFDQSAARLSELRRKLYADWCKYLACAYPPLEEQDHYPDMDAVRAFIEQHRVLPAEAARIARREARMAREAAERNLRGAIAASGELRTRIDLRVRPPPRFWAPKEPAILLAGEGVPPSDRPDPLEPRIGTVHDIGPFGNAGAITRDQALRLADVAASHPPAAPAQGMPIFLDWQVHLKPLFEGSNLPTDTFGFRPDFVTSKFEFDPASADLRFKAGVVLPDKASPWTQYSGRSILTPHVGRHLKGAVERWLRRELSIAAKEPLIATARAKVAQNKNAVAETILTAYELLFGQSPPLNFLAQALTGLNAALLMQRQIAQLPIADPLGFAEDRVFAERVALAVGKEMRSSPMPLTEFHPIRTGLLEIEALRLVDHFGRAREITFEGPLIPAEAMRVSDPQYTTTALLRPRLVQPARLKFRWLDAANRPADVTEATELRRDSAICGWVVRDMLDHSLLVFAANGAPLGRLTYTRHWHQAPGGPRIAPWQIENDHLARLVVHLLRCTNEQLEKFLDKMLDQLQGIVPDEFAAYDGATFLVGRPLAVVRASLELQLYGAAVSRQDWSTFRRELAGLAPGGAGVDGFDGVRFAVRLGDDGQLNDGLVAFWEEAHTPDGRCSLEGKPLIAQQRSEIALSVADGMRFVTMLLDPRAPVHARAGILPTKSITVPKAHYADVIGHLELAVPVGPVLMPQDAIAVFAPDTTRYAVSWVQHELGEWHELPIALAPSARAEALAPTVVRHGWLKLVSKQGATQ